MHVLKLMKANHYGSRMLKGISSEKVFIIHKIIYNLCFYNLCNKDIALGTDFFYLKKPKICFGEEQPWVLVKAVYWEAEILISIPLLCSLMSQTTVT